MCASPELLAAVTTAKQFLTYVNGAPFQHAIVTALGLPDTYYSEFAADLAARRDLLTEGLRRAGLDVLQTQGTYFVTVDIRSVGETDGLAFCRDLPGRCGVVAVPSSVFYDDVEVGRSLVRFTFCKQRSLLTEAVARLERNFRS